MAKIQGEAERQKSTRNQERKKRDEKMIRNIGITPEESRNSYLKRDQTEARNKG